MSIVSVSVNAGSIISVSVIVSVTEISLVWMKRNINSSNCLCAAVLCTIIVVHSGTSSAYWSVNCIGFDIFRAPLQSLWCYIYIYIFLKIYYVFYLF